MNERAEGFIEGLGAALLLARKYGKNTSAIIRDLTRITEQAQLVVAEKTIDILMIHKPEVPRSLQKRK
jgi:hypothetical protein